MIKNAILEPPRQLNYTDQIAAYTGLLKSAVKTLTSYILCNRIIDRSYIVNIHRK